MSSLLSQLSDEDFLRFVTKADSIRNLAELIGYRRQIGGVQRMVKARIEAIGADVSHFGRRLSARLSEGKTKYSLDEILVEYSSYTNIFKLKKRLVSEGVLKYECERCSNTGLWMGEAITLQLDHKNGKPDDHRRENIRFLCPNCHSQTSNFAGRNKLAS